MNVLVESQSRVLLLAVSAVLISLLASCQKTPDDEAITATLEAVATAVQEGSVGDIMSHVSDDFGTVDGAMDRSELRRFAMAHGRINRNVSVTMSGLTITVEDDRASTEFRALVTGGNGRFIPERGRLFDVEAGLRRSGDEWQIISAQWTPVFGE